MIGDAIKKLVGGEDLDRNAMHDVFGDVMDGKASDVQKSAFLVALRMKGETAEEITGAALAMRERVTPLTTNGSNIVDTRGLLGLAHRASSTLAASVGVGSNTVVRWPSLLDARSG